jgi:ribosomal protein L18E
VHAHKFSKSAQEKIEKAGGSCVIVKPPIKGPKVKNKMRPRASKVPL